MSKSTVRRDSSSHRSNRSSATESIPRAPSSGAAWGAQSAVQPTSTSPAVVVNVIQTGASFMASPADIQPAGATNLPSPNDRCVSHVIVSLSSAQLLESCLMVAATLQTIMLISSLLRQSSNGSSNSNGSHQSGSIGNDWNNGNGTNTNGANNNWQTNDGAASGWAGNGPNNSQVPGGWGDSGGNAQGRTTWNNNDTGNNSWPTAGDQPNSSQNASNVRYC